MDPALLKWMETPEAKKIAASAQEKAWNELLQQYLKAITIFWALSRECSTSQHVHQITLSVKDEDGEMFDFKGLPIEFVLELN